MKNEKEYLIEAIKVLNNQLKKINSSISSYNFPSNFSKKNKIVTLYIKTPECNELTVAFAKDNHYDVTSGVWNLSKYDFMITVGGDPGKFIFYTFNPQYYYKDYKDKKCLYNGVKMLKRTRGYITYNNSNVLAQANPNDGRDFLNIIKNVRPRYFYGVMHNVKKFNRFYGIEVIFKDLKNMKLYPLVTSSLRNNNIIISFFNHSLYPVRQTKILCMNYKDVLDLKIYNQIQLKKNIDYKYFAVVGNSNRFKMVEVPDNKQISISQLNEAKVNTFPTSLLNMEEKKYYLTNPYESNINLDMIFKETVVDSNNISIINNDFKLNQELLINTLEVVPVMTHHLGNKNKPVKSIKLVVNHQ